MTTGTTADATLSQIRDAIRLKGDLPSLSSSIARILKSMQDPDLNEKELAQIVLGDFSLSQKVLQLASTPMYAGFGRVTTVSSAIYLLGTEAVGHLALSAKLLDSLDQAAESDRARQELAKAVTAGAVARAVTVSVTGADGESAVLTTLMRSMGRLLVCFYLPEHFEELTGSLPGWKVDENQVKDLLGLTFCDIAAEVCRSWRLPAELVENIKEPAATASAPVRWAHAVTTYSLSFVEASFNGATSQELQAVGVAFEESIGAPRHVLFDQASEAVREARIGLGVALPPPGQANAIKRAIALKVSANLLERNVRDLPPLEIVRRATEMLGQTLNCRSLMFFLSNGNKRVFELIFAKENGRQSPTEIITFDSSFSPDVVHLALASSKRVYLANPQDSAIARRMPSLLVQRAMAAGAMMFLPVSVSGTPCGLAYFDWGLEAEKILFTDEEALQIERHTALISASLARAISLRAVNESFA